MKSDLSGNELGGGNAPATITVRLPDGRQRELRVAVDEAAKLAGKGRAVPAWGRIPGLRPVGRLVKWAVVLFVASLLIPALTKQWTDRSKELETKSAIATKIGETSASTIDTIRYLVGDVLPAASARKAQATALARAKHEGHPVPKARRMNALAAARERKVELATYNKLKNNWGRTSAVIESQLASYFPDSQLPQQWDTYATTVTNYLRLASSVCGDDRKTVLAAVDDYPYATLVQGDERKALLSDLSGDCAVKHRDFQASYFAVGDRLLNEEEVLVRTTVHGHAAGYSSGWRDLWHDFTPSR
jgi:hypothetical protein